MLGKGYFSKIARTGLACFAGLSLLLSPSLEGKKAAQQENKHTTQKRSLDWKEFPLLSGSCCMRFPIEPEHVTESMQVAGEQYSLRYDAYISALKDSNTVFMLLVAQYPTFVDENYSRMSLEGFLNGILTNNPQNQLLFADLVLVDGHEALDFFIRTGTVYFKGRAFMVKNHLYLMAMECQMQQYSEATFKEFVASFKMNKSRNLESTK